MPDPALISKQNLQNLSAQYASDVQLETNLYSQLTARAAQGFDNETDLNNFNSSVDYYNGVSSETSKVADAFNAEYDNYMVVGNQYQAGVAPVQVTDTTSGDPSAHPLYKIAQDNSTVFFGLLLIALYFMKELKI